MITVHRVSEMNKDQLCLLQERLEYTFRCAPLLCEALTHSSYANENKKSGAISNERLEFLGDSVLGMTVSSLIYDMYPDLSEGQMTRLRAELVCEKSLAEVAALLGLGECIRLGRGEEKGRGRERPSILADTVEAVIAAIYLDGGFEPVRRLISEHLAPSIAKRSVESTDYKTSLQEIIQEKSGQTLSYRVTDESGPDHQKTFTVEVSLNGQSLSSGSGKSKKEAEQAAAKAAIEGQGR